AHRHANHAREGMAGDSRGRSPAGYDGGSTVKLQYSGQERIAARPDVVWGFVTEPEKIVACVPELIEGTVRDPSHFEAGVRVAVGALFEKVAAMRRARQSIALATVVARRAPISAHRGARAIVYADGRIEGFVGGACARDIVRTQALESLRVKQPRLVSIR